MRKIRTATHSLMLALGAIALLAAPRAFCQDYPSTGLPRLGLEMNPPVGQAGGTSQAPTLNPTSAPSPAPTLYPSTQAPAVSLRKPRREEAPSLPSFKISSPIQTTSPAAQNAGVAHATSQAPTLNPTPAPSPAPTLYPSTQAPAVSLRKPQHEEAPSLPSFKITSPIQTTSPAAQNAGVARATSQAPTLNPTPAPTLAPTLYPSTQAPAVSLRKPQREEAPSLPSFKISSPIQTTSPAAQNVGVAHATSPVSTPALTLYPSTQAPAVSIPAAPQAVAPSLPSFKITSPIRASIPSPQIVNQPLSPLQTNAEPPVVSGGGSLQFPAGPSLEFPAQPIKSPVPPTAPLATAAPIFPPNANASDPLITVGPQSGPQFPLFSLPKLETATPTQPNEPALHLPSNIFQPPVTDIAGNASADKDEDPKTDEDSKDDPDSAASPVPDQAVANNTPSEYLGGYESCDDTHGPHAYFDPGVFSPDPNYDHIPYNSVPELGVYEGKWNMCSQRPLIELGRGMYRNGVVPKSYSFLGSKNLITPGFLLFGDFRSAIAGNDNGAGETQYVWANRLNLNFDLRLTATERIHAFWGPLDEDGRFTRVQTPGDGRDDLEFFEEFDDDFDTLFFEGDLGYIWGGFTDQWAPFDLPIVAGKFPLLFQNGVWMNDAVEGFAFTIPAQHSAPLQWSNFDLTMFFLFDDIDSLAFAGDDNAADAYGFNFFLEAYGGYTEAGYAYLEDRTGLGRSYHNMTVGFTRRYRQRLSNSIRVIVNAGQDPNEGAKTADGQLVIIENSLVSSNPTYYVPYCNVFAGFGTPQNLAGQAVLQNVGINFETDALTGFPKLDDRGHDTWGGAFGFNLLGPRFAWQWILEASMVQNFGDNLVGDQYAVGTRIQKSLNYAWLARFDAMYGIRENDTDLAGVRAELRWKF